jgi:hypothetical protein
VVAAAGLMVAAATSGSDDARTALRGTARSKMPFSIIDLPYQRRRTYTTQ